GRDGRLRLGHRDAGGAALGTPGRAAGPARLVARLGWVAAATAAALLPALTGNTYYLYLGCSAGLLVIVTAGLNVLAGFTGPISLGHAGFYALGAYTAALVAVRLGWPMGAAAAAAVLLAALVGAAVAGAALRVSGPYLAMVTIAFGIIVEHVLVEWVSLTGGARGIFKNPPRAIGPPRSVFGGPPAGPSGGPPPTPRAPRGGGPSPALGVGARAARGQEQRGGRGVARPLGLRAPHRRVHDLRGLRRARGRPLRVPQRLHLAGQLHAADLHRLPARAALRRPRPH